MLTDTPANDNDICTQQTQENMVWAKVAVAVDSGAVAHVAPANVFSLTINEETKAKGKYYAADGSPIDNLGSQTVSARDCNGVGLQLEFDVAKITKPLASVYSITRKGNNVVFEENGGYILNVNSNLQAPQQLL